MYGEGGLRCACAVEDKCCFGPCSPKRRAKAGSMSWLGWFTSRRAPADNRSLRAWRETWSAAAAAGDTAQAEPLRARLDSLGLPDEEIEIEREMLQALTDLADLAAAVRHTGLPDLPTGHRVVGADRCHFTAPASMPDEVTQPSGRLLLTSGRAIFVGGANGPTVPWHMVSDVAYVDRDLVLVRNDGAHLYRFRCNSFSDAVRAAFLARELVAARRRPAAGL
jgi:hypothetical protein